MTAPRLRWPALASLTLALAVPAAAAPATGEVTIYRCTDAQGRLALRDTPCRAGERQQVRAMRRPADPPPRVARTARAAAAPAPAMATATRVVVVTPPRPLYECVTPDGERYTSDTDAGQPRWVPLWTLGYAPSPRHARFDGGGLHAHVGGRLGDDARYALHLGRAHRPRPPHPPHAAVPLATGTWVQDRCHALPPAEVCARLRDRRYVLDRRYHSALQSERERITTEQRGIDARLAEDCGDR